MPVAHLTPNARVVQVVFVRAAVGQGTPADPAREVDLYYSLDGEELACFDPFHGPLPFHPFPDGVGLASAFPKSPALADPVLWADDPVPSAHDGYRAECKRLYGNYEPYGTKRFRQALSLSVRGGLAE